MNASAPCKTSDPEDLEEQLRHARHLLRSSQIDQAKDLCLGLYSLGHQGHELCRLLGLAHHALGDLENAGFFFAEAARHAPLNAIYHYNHGMALTEQGKTEAAIIPLQTAARINPDFAEAYLALGNISMVHNQPDEAVTKYAAAIEADRGCRSAYYNLAMAYTKLGSWQSAAAALAKAAALPPPDAGIFLQLGDLLCLHNRLPEAMQAYVKAIDISPDNAAILEKLGDVSSRLGDNASAIAYYQRTLVLNPGNCKVMNNLGVSLHNEDRGDEAISLYRQALHLSYNLAEVHYNLGNALMAKGEKKQAGNHYLAATRLKPDYLDAWFNLGVSLQKQQQFAEAEKAHQQVLTLEPSNAQAIFNLALVQQAQQRLDEAIVNYGKALKLDRNFVQAHYNLGIALNEAGRHADAVVSFQAAHALEPGDVKILNNLGLTLHDMGNLDQAITMFLSAIDLRPDFADAFANLGNTYLLQGRETEAHGAYHQALACDPRSSKAYYNLGCLFLQQNAPDNAIAMYRKAIEIDPCFVEAHWNMSNALLLRGDLAEGFHEYRWRWQRKTADGLVLPLPEWQGEPRPDGTILIVTEQGKGDTIQFVRYLPVVKKLIGRIVLACEVSLRKLMASMPEIDVIIAKHEIPAYCAQAECYAPLLDLPDILHSTVAEIPGQFPYLQPDQDRVADFSRLFSDFGNQLKVGIVWQGNPQHRNDHNRSCRPEEFAPLADLPGITLFSLQKANSPGNEPPAGVIDLAAYLDSFADTAALMSHLDLVIAVDTATAHLAGALGGPVWTLLPYVPDWRWMLHRDDTPWYPSMRLFRQSADKTWGKVIPAVREHLLWLRDNL